MSATHPPPMTATLARAGGDRGTIIINPGDVHDNLVPTFIHKAAVPKQYDVIAHSYISVVVADISVFMSVYAYLSSYLVWVV